MNEPTKLDYIDKALSLAKKRHNEIKSNTTAVALEPMYNSIVQQLIFLRKIILGHEKNKAKLWELTFGAYAAKEFENSDEIFFERLANAYFIADQIRNGLKVKLPHEVNNNYEKTERRLAMLYPDDYNV
ncbi:MULTISPECIES: immunity protein Tsi6 family protein [unclassified Brenneria]|uniref:immunity protein Tsi6 family protein n=1 Tax=unclassified Brenneria TaxID=2634434 RepID=UPI0029C46DA7|nr:MULTISPECIES: immunity protein Tsi6 family protein [unclassified Brenneria]MDX5629086.1 immunity protein Tsi6 family protein [Brenneria sp. L3-3Z]MDX5696225.1 immunity protein Tsi6 family protein [Brenneria sp. L4-2C]MEE3662915.1 immunity protein Tsi6 family protein [Brenneria sp. g21c3]